MPARHARFMVDRRIGRNRGRIKVLDRPKFEERVILR
jgi:hypothetical protein